MQNAHKSAFFSLLKISVNKVKWVVRINILVSNMIFDTFRAGGGPKDDWSWSKNAPWWKKLHLSAKIFVWETWTKLAKKWKRPWPRTFVVFWPSSNCAKILMDRDQECVYFYSVWSSPYFFILLWFLVYFKGNIFEYLNWIFPAFYGSFSALQVYSWCSQNAAKIQSKCS